MFDPNEESLREWLDQLPPGDSLKYAQFLAGAPARSAATEVLDRHAYRMTTASVPYKVVAGVLGCTVGKVQKRVARHKRRMPR